METKSTVALPVDTKAEQAVLGSVILDSAVMPDVLSRVGPMDFVDPDYRVLFRVMIDLHRSCTPIDTTTLLSPLRNSVDNPGGLISSTLESVPNSVNAKHYSDIVKELSIKRRLQQLGGAVCESASNGQSSTEIITDLLAGVEDLQRNDDSKRIEQFTVADLQSKYPKLYPPVVDGLFRQGETVNVVSVSKIGKSWLAYNLALCVITGTPWLDQFNTTRGKALLIDNELHRSTLAQRIPTVAEAMSLRLEDYASDFVVWSLRGNLRGLDELVGDFDKIPHGEYQVIILDAKYRFSTGASENDNAAETQLYNLLDQYAEKTGAAFVLIHHSSKGDQGDKRVTDVGSGAGAQSRAADCHLVLREHEEDGVAVLDAAVRSFAPVESLALRWAFPLWIPDGQVDAGKLKGRLNRNEQKQLERDKEGKDEIIKALREGPSTARELRKKTSLSKDRQERLLNMLCNEGSVMTQKTEVRGNECDEYHLSESED